MVAAGATAVAATYLFSRLSGALSDSVVMPVGAPAFVLAVLLCAWAPRRYGLSWGTTGDHLLLVVAMVLAVAAVVGVFRMTGSSAPYDASAAEIVLVPVGEELLFRGFVLVSLLEVFRRQGITHSGLWAVLVGAVAFGVGHLGNLGHVEAAFVVLQVFVATVFGLAAGCVRVRTDSIVGPVLMHATMNAVAVV